MKEVLETGLYAPSNIYNMDECGFDLSSSYRKRTVAPQGASIKSQAALAAYVHITAISTISTCDALVPPFLVYPGKNLMTEWFTMRDEEPKQMAEVTDSGYSNGYMHLRWLTECFDPYTRDRANGERRLLFLDGVDFHITVDFLETCWDRNIVCIILPAHLSAIFQPLDVNIFGEVKRSYDKQIRDYQLGSEAVSVPKTFFYLWHQRTWSKATTSRQIRSAWSKAQLYPLSANINPSRPVTPPRQAIQHNPETPHTSQAIRALEQSVRQGKITPRKAFRTTEKALEKVMAAKQLLEQDLERREAASQLDRVARGSKKRQRFPQGQLFDQKYQEDHAEELAKRKREENDRKKTKRSSARAKGKENASNWEGSEPEITGMHV